MLISLHELICDIQYRYLHQWHHSVLYNIYPNVQQAAGQIELLDHKLKILLSHSFSLSAHKAPQQLSFSQFLTLKKECIIDEWPTSPPTQPLSNAWYWHDRFTMYGVHYLIMQIILHNQNHLDLSDCPALVSFVDTQTFTSDIEKIKAQLHHDDYVWLKKMEQQFSTLPWQVQRLRLKTKINHPDSTSQPHDLIHQCINIILQTIPSSRHEEIVLTSLMIDIHTKLKSGQVISNPVMVIRDIILRIVKVSDTCHEWQISLLDIYLNYLEHQEHLVQFKREHRFWQPLACQHPENWILKYINLHLNEIRTAHPETTVVTKPLFYWSASVQDFIGCFHPLIARGKIQLKGNSDMVPIVTILHQLFEIPKSRGIGLVSCPSLLTYFKNVNANAN